MRTRMIVWHMLAATLGMCGAALAGVFTAIGETGGSYSLNECEKPAKPDLSFDDKLTGRARSEAYNAAVARYNLWTEASNAYVACITAEAERDLQTYYKAVTASLEAEQDSVIGEIDAEADALQARRRKGGA